RKAPLRARDGAAAAFSRSLARERDHSPKHPRDDSATGARPSAGSRGSGHELGSHRSRNSNRLAYGGSLGETAEKKTGDRLGRSRSWPRPAPVQQATPSGAASCFTPPPSSRYAPPAAA